MQFDRLKRREFITLLGGVAAWPVVAGAQQGERVRRIGVFMNLAADDPEGQDRVTAFVQALQQLGWIEGRNMRIDYRWARAGRDVDLFHKYALELVALAPDVILASGFPSMAALQPITRSVPVVFVLVGRPASQRKSATTPSAARGSPPTSRMAARWKKRARWRRMHPPAPRSSTTGVRTASRSMKW
jgi:putative ABC transport system substrate-binding protein